MDVVDKVRVPFFVHVVVLEILGTILVCYGIAVSLGHVPAWLPMISDCAVYAPEKYPFRLGLIVGAVLLEVEILLVYYAEKGICKSHSRMVIGSVATLCLGVVGAVNEQENNTIHSGCAVIFFLGIEVYMIITCCTASSLFNWSAVTKAICTAVTAVAIIALAVMSISWGKYKVYIAVCEWTATLSILLFQWTFAFDLSSISICEVETTEKEQAFDREKDVLLN